MMTLIFAVPIVFVFCLVMWLQKRGRINDPLDVAQATLSLSDAGIIDVPIRQLQRLGRFGGLASNSFSPALQILPEGLRFKLFRQTLVPFAEIAQVDVRKGILGCPLTVRSRGQGTYIIVVRDLTIAKAFLTALPASVPLSDDAVHLRGG